MTKKQSTIPRDDYWDSRTAEFVAGIVPEEQRAAFYKWVREYSNTPAAGNYKPCPVPLVSDIDYAGYYMSNLIGDQIEALSRPSGRSMFTMYEPARVYAVKPLYIKFIDYGEIVNNDNPGITPTF